MLGQKQFVGFITGEPGAVNARLLTDAHTDDLPIISYADGIRLGISQRHGSNQEGLQHRVRHLLF